MAGAIQRLLEDPELRKTLGSYAEQRARQQFGWPAVAARYSEELRRVIDRGGRRARALAETD
jgi:glycosyltransferase involved in cell wall biosynthesis